MNKRRVLVLAQCAILIGILVTLTGCPDLLGGATDDPTAPLAPNDLSFTGITATSITVSWDEVGGATSYTLLRDTAYNGTFATQVYAGANTAAIDDGLEPNTTYYYKLRASNAVGNSPYSSVADVTTSATPIAAPASLTSSNVTYNSGALTWSAVTGATKYQLVRDVASNGSFSTIVYEGTATSADDTGLSDYTIYYYKVRANDANGWGAFTNPVSLQTLLVPGAPSAPANLTVEGQSENFILLSWDPVTDALGYQLYRSTSLPVTTVDTLVYNGTSTSKTDTDDGAGLSPGTTYYYAVGVTTATGSSALSTTIPGSTSGTAVSAPSAPSTISITDFGADFVTLTWAVSSGASSYTLYRSTTSTVTTSATVAYSDVGTEFTDTGLTTGTTYYYAVAAGNSQGDSGLSVEVSETPVAPPAEAPTNLTASTVSDTEIAVSWGSVGGAVEYQLERDTSSAFSAPATVYSGGISTSFSDTGLNPNTSYYYRVKARNAVGFGDYSMVSSERTDPTPLTVPPAPANFTVDSFTDSSITVSWDEVADASGYILYADTVSPVTLDAGNRIYSSSTGTSYSYSGLAVSTTHNFAVIAWNGVGSSTAATLSQATDPATTLDIRAATPAGAVSSPTVDTLTIGWTALSGATDYWVYVSEYPTTTGSTTQIYDGPATSIGHSGRQAGTTYYYTVVGYNSMYQSQSSSTVLGTTLPPKPANPGIEQTFGSETTSLDIYWDSVSTNSAVGPTYEYRIATSTAALASASIVSAGASTFATVTASSGTTYYFQARAVLAGGSGPWSNTRSAATAAVLAAPTGVSVTESGADLAVSWSAVTGASAYDVLRGPTSGGPWTQVATGVATTSYTDTTVGSDTVYWYAIVATDGTGAGEPSVPAFGTTPPAIPATPTGLTATVIDASSIAVSWDAVADADYYVVTRNGVALPNKIATSFTDSGLSSATTYEYTVAAENAAGTSAASAPVSRTTMLAPPSTAPANLTFVDATETSIDLSWSLVAGATRYKIYRAYAGGSFGYIAQVMDPNATYTDIGLDHSTSYEYKISAANGAGEGPLSTAAIADTDVGLDPPYEPSLDAVFNVTDTAVTVSWFAVSNATSYELYRSTDSTVDGTDDLVHTGTDTSYEDTGLTASTQYWWAVKAVNLAGENWSSPLSRTTLAAPPPTPSNPAITYMTVDGPTEIYLEYAADNATSYAVYRSTDATVNETDTLIYEGPDYWLTDSGLTPSTLYYYAVRGSNVTGTSGFSTAVSETTEADGTPTTAPTLRIGSFGPYGDHVLLDWDAVPDTISGYIIYRSTSDVGIAHPSNHLAEVYEWEGTTVYEDSNVSSPDQYYYAVTAINGTSEGPASNVVRLGSVTVIGE